MFSVLQLMLLKLHVNQIIVNGGMGQSQMMEFIYKMNFMFMFMYSIFIYHVEHEIE